MGSDGQGNEGTKFKRSPEKLNQKISLTTLESITNNLKIESTKKKVYLPPPSIFKIKEALFNTFTKGVGTFQFVSTKPWKEVQKKTYFLRDFFEKNGLHPLILVQRRGKESIVAIKIYDNGNKRDAVIRKYLLSHASRLHNIQYGIWFADHRITELREKRDLYIKKINQLKKTKPADYETKIKKIQLKIHKINKQIQTLLTYKHTLEKKRKLLIEETAQYIMSFDHFYQSLVSSEKAYYSTIDYNKLEKATKKFAELALGTIWNYNYFKEKAPNMGRGEALIISAQFSLIQYMQSHGLGTSWKAIAKYNKGEFNVRTLAENFAGSTEDNLFLACIGTAFFLGETAALTGDFKVKYYAAFKLKKTGNTLEREKYGHGTVALKDTYFGDITYVDGTTLLPGQ